MVYWPSGFLEAWGTKAKKPQFSRNILFVWPCRKAKKPVCSWKIVVFWPWYPRPPKTTWPINHYGIPLNSAITHKEPALHRRRCPAEFKDHRLVPNVWAEDSSNKLPWHPNHTPTCCDRRTRHHACNNSMLGHSIRHLHIWHLHLPRVLEFTVRYLILHREVSVDIKQPRNTF